MTTITRTHQFVLPAPGHVDGPNACDECGHGPLAPQHGDIDRVAITRAVAQTWLDGLQSVGGNAAFGVQALRAVLAALDGETDMAKLVGFHGMRGHLTPAAGDQPVLPLAAA